MQCSSCSCIDYYNVAVSCSAYTVSVSCNAFYALALSCSVYFVVALIIILLQCLVMIIRLFTYFAVIIMLLQCLCSAYYDWAFITIVKKLYSVDPV
jgi:hypothetical protein